MRLFGIAITIILTFNTITYGQSNSYNEDIVSYLEVNGTETQYAQAVEQLFVMLSKQYAGNNISNDVWRQLETKYKTKALKSIKLLLVTPYRTTFSHDNIKRMLAFYNTEAGKQMMIDPTKLTKAQKSVAGDFYASDAGAKLLENKTSLEQRVAEVSEIWSRDLYRMVTEDLQQMGYTTGQ
ncbi:DUF2059 domain-containing protein [Croceibacter atlanticus]|jgi:hypothetical protein|uniref:DUF2059 domain-containing protein n=1 Tax=Croceibacter atlanticus (strain ATCC BAA-628 / JCM 21780 / CIP 108009 / IAM 15332 / KCTC 12090 / HTCC2559) TaxID=216432 RepID=A3U8U6_CROAH|nr:DUF2059 domain-containing protein [Croceibacter atlanticus]EAP86232.1 hypothetical protein CA2559_09368 [Croceibacter atlanticus HTCC2559]MBW4968907.1 DUF2059 domain-containing protein [Croceibacter atlanticus]WSP33905.1 DUF2059 domain-containing protein [Croceibacter atlanticus]